MELLVGLLALGLAVARITALIVFDAITEPIRHRIFLLFPPQPAISGEELSHYAMMDRHEQPLEPEAYRDEHKVGVLFSCFHCVGVWVAGFVWAAVVYAPEWLVLPVVAVAALAQLSDVFVKATRSDA